MTIKQVSETREAQIGDIFEDERLKSFVYDFYHDVYVPEDIWAIGDLYREIISDEETYQEFMKYCLKLDFPFSDTVEWKKQGLAITLATFESLRRMVVENIQSILHTPQQEIQQGFEEELLMADLRENMWLGLEAAVDAGIPVNDRWEVLYMIKIARKNIYVVYSHESKLHLVDKTWKILWSLEEGKPWIPEEMKDSRVAVIKTIQKYERFQWILKNKDFTENDVDLMNAIKQAFETHDGIVWEHIEWDV